MSNKNKTLGEFIIENQTEFQYSTGELSKLINAIRLAAKVVNHEVNKAGLVDVLGTSGDTNIQGESQQKLDVLANEKFIQTLKNREIVCGIASEEEDDFISINSQDENHQNKYVVLIDPLDGSSNIDVNVSVGTIFSIYRRITPVGTPVTLEDFLQPGKKPGCRRLYYLWNFYHVGLYYRAWSQWFYPQSSHRNLLSFTPQYAISRNRENLFRQ